jgi:hypothetical protein
MTIDERIKALSLWGKRLQETDQEKWDALLLSAASENPWFTSDNIQMAWKAVIKFLDENQLNNWLKRYHIEEIKPKTIALVMAGNIPMVGFHDLLCVLASGHKAAVKLSSKDSVLMRYLTDILCSVSPDLAGRISFHDRLKNFDAVIATGGDNASRYFEYYFGQYPHIIRKNRTSCAVITGDETESDFTNLGVDIFSYFGLGCRNISKLYVPNGYNFIPMLKSFEQFSTIIHHHKYNNNYDYQKSIMLVNKVPFLDNGSLMLTASERLVSPISVVYYEAYPRLNALQQKIGSIQNKIQCIVGSAAPATVPFGQAQFPDVEDYADQVDTLKFLCALN